jgi:hypothetical protein
MNSQQRPALEPEMIPHGMKSALICLDEGPWREAARAYLSGRGYHLMDEPDPETAAARLRLNAVDAVVASEDKTAALQEMHERPGLRRRETVLFLVGAFASLDPWAAFASGADWVLAEADAPRCPELMAEAFKRQEALREPWRLAEDALGG